MSNDKIEVRPIAAEFRPEAAISALTAVASERRTLLLCNAVRQHEDGVFRPAGVGVYEFELARMSAYGWPNDEACMRHPVFGLAIGTGLYEIANSPWSSWVTEQNRYSFPRSTGGDSRHFFVLGHDSSFNCLARAVTTRLVPTWSEALSGLAAIAPVD